MSRVLLITADKPLPLCDKQEERTTVVEFPVAAPLAEKLGGSFTVTTVDGFKVDEHIYYRAAVDELGYSMKPYQYELQLQACETDVNHLRDYLTANFAPGEEAELLNLWVGTNHEAGPARFKGALADFDLESLEQFLNPPMNAPLVGQCRMTITI